MNRKNKAMRNFAALACIAAAVVLAIGLVGCGPAADKGPVVTRPSTEQDPCADRLQDLCGVLLEYYAFNSRTLPPDTAAIARLAPGIELKCPTSGLPYVYRPEGLAYPGQPGPIIMHDAAPSHSGMRWGIRAEGLNSRTCVFRPVLLPESRVFHAE